MVVVVGSIVGAVFFATGKFSDGGHGRTVGLNERSIVSYSVDSKKKIIIIHKIKIIILLYIGTNK